MLPSGGRRGETKPETFDFLGFTHICGKMSPNTQMRPRRNS